MSHFVSGILKIMLLEASLALLLLDKVAGDRFERARRTAFVVLSGLMVFAWSNYGALRGGASAFWVLVSVLVILGLWWLWRAGFEAQPSPAMASLQKWADGVGAKVRLSQARARRTVAVAMVVLAAAFWVFQGVRMGAAPLVHQWEQFHFYLGAKYQKELGWFDLYTAAIIADRESPNPLNITKTRDISTFEEISVEQALKEEPRIRAKFTPERWAAFRTDWQAMKGLWGINWPQVLTDHGNSNSPAWAILAHPIASLVPLSARNQSYLGWIDLLLMLVLWFFVHETFGTRVAATGLLLWAAPPIVFDYLTGSFLRWDWLFAVGMAACFLKRERYAVAGAFFGFAVASKLFPLLFGVALAMQVGWQWWTTKARPAAVVPFFKGTVIAGAVAVLVSAAMFGGPSAWVEYARRIQTAQVEKYYAIQYSLKTVYLQVAESSGDELSQGWFFPKEIKQARADVDIANHKAGFFLARLLFTLLVFALARRATQVEAFLLGPLLVFTWLTVNMYYWNMLGLLALGLATRAHRSALGLLLGLHGAFMTFYLYQHLNRGLSEAYAVSVLICGLLIASAAVEWKDATGEAKAKAAPPAPQKAKAR